MPDSIEEAHRLVKEQSRLIQVPVFLGYEEGGDVVVGKIVTTGEMADKLVRNMEEGVEYELASSFERVNEGDQLRLLSFGFIPIAGQKDETDE